MNTFKDIAARMRACIVNGKGHTWMGDSMVTDNNSLGTKTIYYCKNTIIKATIVYKVIIIIMTTSSIAPFQQHHCSRRCTV